MLIVVLGGGIDSKGVIPLSVHRRLDEAVELQHTHPESSIVVSGKYSFLYSGKKPSTTEADKMAEYLRGKGIPQKKIILEKRSKDTIGNAYYLKKYVFMPKSENNAYVITSHFHLPRVKYIFAKIFGSSYHFTFLSTKDDLVNSHRAQVEQHQEELLLETKELLSNMPDGDHDFLKRKIYNVGYYRKKRESWVRDFVTKGIL